MESFGCPHKFASQYVAKNTITTKRDQETGAETTPPLEFGKATHEVMAEFINHIIDATMPEKDGLIERVFKKYQIDPVRFTEFSEVNTVSFYINGKRLNTLGQLDISNSLYRDESWIKKN